MGKFGPVLRCSSLHTVTDVARSLTFAPAVRVLADRVIASMSGSAGSGMYKEYNAVHLRLEKDARDWSVMMGGEAVRPDIFSLSFCFPGPYQTDSVYQCLKRTFPCRWSGGTI